MQLKFVDTPLDFIREQLITEKEMEISGNIDVPASLQIVYSSLDMIGRAYFGGLKHLAPKA